MIVTQLPSLPLCNVNLDPPTGDDATRTFPVSLHFIGRAAVVHPEGGGSLN